MAGRKDGGASSAEMVLDKSDIVSAFLLIEDGGKDKRMAPPTISSEA